MKIKDIMRKDFLSFQADAKLPQIVHEFSEKYATSAPVFDRGEFLGIVSDEQLVRFFTPKKFLFLWKKDATKPLEKIKKITAGDLAAPPKMRLKPEQNLYDVLEKIADSLDCIPVMEGKKVVGLVRSEDIVEFFQRELAKDEFGKISLSEGTDKNQMDTAMDQILSIVRRDGEVSCRKISNELGISFKTTEKLCETLSHHKLIEMKFSFLNGPIVNSFTEGPKIKVRKNEKK